MKFLHRISDKICRLLHLHSLSKLVLHLGLALTLPLASFTVQGLFTPIQAQTVSNLSITSITSTPTVAAGGAATYTIRVSNPTNSSISNVSITDNLPTGFTFDATIGVPNLQNSALRNTTVNPTFGNTSPNWGTFTLPPSASVAITFTANIPATQTLATYQNPVTVVYTNTNGTQTESYNTTASSLDDTIVSAAPPNPPASPTAPVRSAAGICANPGQDGFANTGGVLNTYYPGTSSASAGATSISLGTASANGSTTGIQAGDLLLVIQMQDATINSSNSNQYGSGTSSNDGQGQTNMGNTGIYEYVVATNSVSTGGGTLNFEGTGTSKGLRSAYTNANPTSSRGQRRFQVIRVPQYSNLTLSSTLSSASWDGLVGGMIAVDVAGQLNFSGRTIDAATRGFRGGYSEKSSSGTSVTDYVATTNATGAGKAEGTAGTPQFVWNGTAALNSNSQGYPAGDYGRGAPANAGGGGNVHNAGGGGGGNGGKGGKGGLPWEGSNGALDSGGRGGALSSTATFVPTRLFLGGGGGGGDANNATTGVRGGVGGGLVMIRAGNLTGSGSINVAASDGQVGVYNSAPDGAGGGGAGGTVLIATRSNSSASLTINANGGAGGNTLNDPGTASGTTTTTAHGPGGGGGGGVILYNSDFSGVSLTSNINGGVNGKTSGGTGTDHGAVAGSAGQVVPFTNSSDPFATINDAGCLPLLSVWKTTSTPQIVQGGSATYKITVSNAPGRTTATSVNIKDLLPTGFTYESTTAIVLGTGVTRTTVTNPSAGTSTPTWGNFSIPTGSKVEITFTAATTASTAAGTYQNAAQAIYLDPQRSSTTGTATASYDTTNAGEDVTVTAPTSSSNSNILLVKRITAIGQQTINPNDATKLSELVPDTNSTNANWPSNYLKGAIAGGNVKSGDEIEYTIYFLNAGRGDAKSFTLCDRISPNQSFKTGAYGGTGKDLQIKLGSSAEQYLTAGTASSGSRTRIYAANATVPTTCNLQSPNDNGTIVVEVTGLTGTPNLSIVPGSVGSGTPTSSYGLIRFTTRVF